MTENFSGLRAISKDLARRDRLRKSSLVDRRRNVGLTQLAMDQFLDLPEGTTHDFERYCSDPTLSELRRYEAAIGYVEQVIGELSEVGSSTSDSRELLEELEKDLERELPCQHRRHNSDENTHDKDSPASVRGVAPCGKTLNICSKFHTVLVENGWFSLRCQCGKRHFSSQLSFQLI